MLRMSNAFWGQEKGSKEFKDLSLLEAAERAGFIRQASAGFWELDCFGASLFRRLERFWAQRMEALGAHEARFALCQDAELWRKTRRLEDYGQELFSLKTREGKSKVLAATAEEAVCAAAQAHLGKSSRSLWVWQSSAKWRDEIRARGGLARSKEFWMLDAYSFCQDQAEARLIHERAKDSFKTGLARLGIQTEERQADCGEIGGKESHELICQSAELGDANGELELAHLFLLGTKYSEAFGLRGKSGAWLEMGCQGLGISRLLMALLEKRRTAKGFSGDEWACSRLFWIAALDWERNGSIRETALELAQAAGHDGILDDRDLAAGRKLFDSELCMGAWRCVVGKQSMEKGLFEFEALSGEEKIALSKEEALNFIREKRASLAL